MSSPTCGAVGRNGFPCRRHVAPGFTRCALHGGHTPLARQAAAEALARAALPAAEVMFDIIDRWQQTRCPTCGMPSGDPSPVIRAAQIVLDRTGFGPSATMQVAPAPEYALPSHLTLAQLADRAEAVARRLRAAADAEGQPEVTDAEVLNEGDSHPPQPGALRVGD